MNTAEVADKIELLLQSKSDTEKILQGKRDELQSLLAKESLDNNYQRKEKIAALKDAVMRCDV